MSVAAIVLSTLLFVNPFIGSGGHGHVFVGADIPHGEVHAGPMNKTLGWDWCSGYHDSDTTLIGFAQTRLNGTGVADYGDIIILPQSSADTSFVDTFSKSSETARPGYYSLVSNSGIRTEVTADAYCANYRISYPSPSAYLKLNLRDAAKSLLFRKGFEGGEIRQTDRYTIVGKRISNEWTFEQPIWFIIRFDSPIRSFESDGESYAIIGFGKRRKLDLTVAVSQKGPDALGTNLASNKGFEKTLRQAEALWEETLSRIEFKGFEAAQDTIFRTALYHTAVSPQLFSDFGEEPQYTIFSLWDTYRATHPLYNLIDPNAGAYCNSMLDIFDRTGRLPVWTLGDRETDCMVGVHSIAVLCEAALKGIPGVDPERVLKACKTMIDQPTYGMDIWDRYGYLPADKVNWSVSVELEYCIDAAALSRLADKLGDTETKREYAERSLRYRRHFDSQTGFLRGVLSDGSFREPFNPSFSLHDEADFIEGNSWQYTFMVPHDMDGLASLYGSREAFESKLDALFEADSYLNEGASADITGMIGQYAHGNEPSHHTVYFYSLIGRPDKASRLLRYICSEFYTTRPDGLIGNEDCGQMSAWYVFTALGFYPVDPTGGLYVFGSPLCTEATVHLTNGNTLHILAPGNDSAHQVIESVVLNGVELDRPYITHEEIMCGGELIYNLK